MADKVHGGTPDFGEHLCDKCVYAFNRTMGGKDTRLCTYTLYRPHSIVDKVTKCSKFIKVTDTPLILMKEIAWHIDVSDRVPPGFAQPEREVQVVKPKERIK